MQRFRQLLIMAIFLFVGYLFLANTEVAKYAVSDGLKLCATAILPTLFPFFILSELWVRSGNAAEISALSAPVTEKLFHLSGNITPAFLLGIIGGYPIGARTISQLYQQNMITKEDAEKAMLFCNNAGPAFIIGIVGMHVFQSVYTGILLYGIHVVSAILIGIILRPKSCSQKCSHIQITKSYSNRASMLTESITNGGQTALLVCTYILLFSLITKIITSELTDIVPNSHNIPLLGLIELTNGINMLAKSEMSDFIRFIYASFFLGFGGGCIILQSLSLVTPTGLSAKNILIGNILHGLCSALLARLLWPVYSFTSVSVFSNISPQTNMLSQILPTVTIPLIFILITKITTGKRVKNRI